MKNIIVSNFGNDSIALIQWCINHKIENLEVVCVDTKWANSIWKDRCIEVKQFLNKNKINLKILESAVSFSDAVIEKKEFPNQKFQWCAGILKGLPILEWLDEIDSFCEANILIAALKSSSRGYFHTSEVIDESEHFGDRKVWHPILELSRQQRDELILQSGISLLSFNRSLECDPCVNCQIKDLTSLSDNKDIEKVVNLEKTLNKTLFEVDIKTAVNQSKKLKGQDTKNIDNSLDSYNMGCGSVYGCGT